MAELHMFKEEEAQIVNKEGMQGVYDRLSEVGFNLQKSFSIDIDNKLNHFYHQSEDDLQSKEPWTIRIGIGKGRAEVMVG